MMCDKSTTCSQAIRIDVGEVLRKKAPRHYRYIPRFLIRWFANFICQDELNEIACLHGHKSGVEFAQGVLNYLGVTVQIDGAENLPAVGSGKYIYVCNHPMGGLEGIALIAYIGGRYGGNVRFLVNDLLMAVTPLANVFLPINKFGRQSREAARSIDEAYAGDVQMLTFPAGLCSRLMDDGTIADLAWQKSFVAKAVEYKRSVVPMYFDGCNSRWFYRVARWRKRLGIGFNIEMMMLPREMMKCRGNSFRLRIGKPIAYENINAGDLPGEALRIRRVCYALASQPEPAE
ncbi:MAG: glycerol acyltransferase [Muribaculaceae bacterium]